MNVGKTIKQFKSAGLRAPVTKRPFLMKQE